MHRKKKKKKKRQDLMTYLIRLGHKVSICVDVCTYVYHRTSYMGKTCHWIDGNWTFKKR